MTSKDPREELQAREDTARELEAQRRADERRDGIRGCLWSALAVIVLAVAGVWYFISSLTFTKGRPLRGRGSTKLRSARAAPAEAVENTAASHWRQMAQEEYESIAAFSELALDLMAARAPLDLVERCHRAALEEARHTAICLELARRLDGNVAEVATVPRLRSVRRRPSWRGALLVRLAVESYFDGWVGEASSARVLARLAREAHDAHTRESLRLLAREEMGHARLGEDIVRWCIAAGGPLVQHALSIARRRAADAKASPMETAAASLRHLGVPDARLRRTALDSAHAVARASTL